jgi:hypothetical protein
MKGVEMSCQLTKGGFGITEKTATARQDRGGPGVGPRTRLTLSAARASGPLAPELKDKMYDHAFN